MKRWGYSFLGWLCLWATQTEAITEEFKATTGGYVYEQRSSGSGGAGKSGTSLIKVGYSPTYKRYWGAVKFDLSSIPAGSTIERARLRLYGAGYSSGTNKNITRDVQIHRLTRNIFEGSFDWETTEFEHKSYDERDVPSHLKWIEWDVRGLVQLWFDGTYINYGFLLKLDNDGCCTERIVYFRSDDHDFGTDHPELIVEYTWGDEFVPQAERRS